LDKKLSIKIKLEIEQIDELFSVYADLLKRARHESPNLIEVTALASILHSFYHGLESIFLFVAKELDQHIPTGTQSHRDLLTQISQSTPDRARVLSSELVQNLAAYLNFRHFYRHSYSFFLDWAKFEALIIHLPEIWVQVKSELLSFLDTLSST
jgi:hypothetical protein